MAGREELIGRHEQIMRRLLAIAETIAEVEQASRNQVLADTSSIKRITVLEGEEIVAEEPFGNRRAGDRQHVMMIPELLIDCAGTTKEVGSELNVMRDRLIRAILTDTELLGLTVNGRSIRYGGMNSDLAFLALMQGKMSLKFRILYALDPSSP